MAIYNISGIQLNTAYSLWTSVPKAYNVNGLLVFDSGGGGGGGGDDWSTDYEHAIITARDEWMAQYSGNSSVIPFIAHTDQHNKLRSDQSFAHDLFAYLGDTITWSGVSACIGLGDVDLSKSTYNLMDEALSAVPRNKRIDLWGNHDLWKNYESIDGEYIVDFDTVYPYFNNEYYGSESHAYNRKGIEYHIDRSHNVKYIVISGWDINANIGGYSHYVIDGESMEGIIDALQRTDGYDIVILSHCNPWGEGSRNMSHCYQMSDGTSSASGSDTLYTTPVAVSGLGNCVVHPSEVNLAPMWTARNNGGSGTIKDSYGVEHSYNFSGLAGKIICGFHGHQHMDEYGYSTANVLQVVFDAFAYQHHPFYMVNVDRTQETVTIWKITDDAVVQKYSVPFHE